MSYDAVEQSQYGSQPYELYKFAGVGFSFRLAAGDEEITYLGEIYSPATVTRSDLEMSNEVVSGQLKITITKDHPLAQMLLPYLPSSPIAVTVFGGHYVDGDAETVVLFTGNVASSRFTDQCEIVCNSAQYLLQRQIPQQLYQAPCSHVFGDPECGADLVAHTFTGTVSAIDSTGTILTVPAFASIPDSLKAGYIRFGNDFRMVVAHSGSTVTLLASFTGLATGGTIFGTAGCNLDFSSCSHYGRTISFLGFDLVPTINPFDGSASVG